jgi:NitT/TauT family transport system permease protein
MLVAMVANSPLVPVPTAVVASLWEVVREGAVYGHLLASVLRVSEAFVASVVIALPVAVACDRIPLASMLIVPSHEFVRYIPVPAFVPLATALFGVDDAAKVVVIFIGTYFQLLFLFTGDLSGVPKEIEDTGRTLGVRGIWLLVRVVLPACLPRLLDSARITFAWAWSYLLVAEVVNARRGIGYLVLQSYRVLNMNRLVALLVVIGVFGVVTDALFKYITRRACPWAFAALESRAT